MPRMAMRCDSRTAVTSVTLSQRLGELGVSGTPPTMRLPDTDRSRTHTSTHRLGVVFPKNLAVGRITCGMAMLSKESSRFRLELQNWRVRLFHFQEVSAERPLWTEKGENISSPTFANDNVEFALETPTRRLFVPILI